MTGLEPRAGSPGIECEGKLMSEPEYSMEEMAGPGHSSLYGPGVSKRGKWKIKFNELLAPCDVRNSLVLKMDLDSICYLCLLQIWFWNRTSFIILS